MGDMGAIELGGTKTLVGAGAEVRDLDDHLSVGSEDPRRTVAAACQYLVAREVEAVGVASFGPVELRVGHPRYGHITKTPKTAWRDFDLLGAISEHLTVPIALDTDVNGSALGEWRWGALSGAGVGAYVTVGTGIGGAILIDGRPAGGISHPEFGHVVVSPHHDDDYPGGCPYHGVCLEGMASGPAIKERFGEGAGVLTGSDLSFALELVAHYLAQGLRDLIYTVAPNRIVIGGGVSKLPGFHEAVAHSMLVQLAGYPGLDEPGSDGYVSAPALGDMSGLAGGLVIAERLT